MNCLIGLQQYTLDCKNHLARLYLFPGSARSWVHNSYTAVQSLLTVITYYILCFKPSYQCRSEDGSPEFSQTFTYYRLWCTYLFVTVKGVYFGQTFNAKQCHSRSHLIYAACLKSLQPFKTLHFAFVSHSSVPEVTWPRRWMFRLCEHKKTKTKPNNIHISLILCQMTFSLESVEWNLPLDVFNLNLC